MKHPEIGDTNGTLIQAHVPGAFNGDTPSVYKLSELRKDYASCAVS
jgi:hypothetical protein